MSRTPSRRLGFSAIELLVSSAIVAGAFLPIYSLMQTNQKVAYLSEYHLVARRQCFRALALVETLPYRILKSRATGGGPPASASTVAPEALEIPLTLPTAAQEGQLFQTPGAMLKVYGLRRKGMTVQVFFQELTPGFAKVSAVAHWTDPTSKSAKTFTKTRFVENPFHFVGVR